MILPLEILKTTPDREIVSTRVFDASRDMLFKAWTNPEHLQNWWGPNGFTNTFYMHDLKPNGKWNFTMHGPDGSNFPQECVFIKIIEPELVAWNHVSTPSFQVLATFEEVASTKTKVFFKMLFITPEECAEKKKYVVTLNEENFDRLETELKKMKI